jgi:hypothetical protein
MRKQNIQDAAFEVATQIRMVEDSIDATLGEVAELQSRLVRASSVSGTGVITAQSAFEQLANAVQALVTARGGMAGCHAALVDAKQRVPGLRTVAFGDVDKCPTTAVAELRIVA